MWALKRTSLPKTDPLEPEPRDLTPLSALSPSHNTAGRS